MNTPSAHLASTTPTTPTAGRGARYTGQGDPGANVSPTSTYSESTENAFRLNDRSTLQSIFATPFTPPVRKALLRSDPSLSTCFDPTDTELYNLWVPRR
ncbi:hypothetical protein AX15_007694 [Amanita polypyramis BW_CC]|nr:hypothetical protein AX15_007694 [Amanita polypyramis BW_CC]